MKCTNMGQALLSISAYTDGECACFIYYLKSNREFFSNYLNPFVPVIHRTKCIEVCFPLSFPILLHSLSDQTHLHIPYIHIIQARSLIGSFFIQSNKQSHQLDYLLFMASHHGY